MLRFVSHWDETDCLLMALDYLYGCVNWIYVWNVVAMKFLSAILSSSACTHTETFDCWTKIEHVYDF